MHAPQSHTCATVTDAPGNARCTTAERTPFSKNSTEAQRQRETIESTTPRPLFVSTSDEQAADGTAPESSKRSPAKHACRKATRSALQKQSKIVERSVTHNADSPPVRQLVDSKLVELGLERYRARHTRLGAAVRRGTDHLLAQSG